jgi:hypothetical protein
MNHASVFVVSALLAASLAAQTPPINDEPSGAIALAPGANSGLGFTTENASISVGLGLLGPSCNVGLDDVWFTFAATTTGVYVFHTTPDAQAAPGSLRDTVLSVVDSTLTAVLKCDDDSSDVPTPDAGHQMSRTALPMTAGGWVYVRVARKIGVLDGTFSVTVAGPSLNGGQNGGATFAAALPITDGVSYGQFMGQTASGVGGNGCSAFSTATPDIWYLYTPTVSGTTIVFVEGLTTAIAFSLAAYDASAGAAGLTAVPGACGASRHTSFAATAGTPYAIRIGMAQPVTWDVIGAFGLSIATLPPTTNDSCSAAAQLVVGDNRLTTTGATPDPALPVACPSGSFSPTTNLDVWGSFTTPAPGRVRFGARGLGTLQFAVYGGSCGALVPIACEVGTSVVSVDDVVGGSVYYVRGGPTSPANVGAVDFDVHFEAFPSNDDCAGATPIFDGTTSGLTNIGATTSPGAPSCFATNNDVWFSWTATTTGTAAISGCGSSGDPLFALYDACGGVELACDDDDAAKLGPCASVSSLAPYLEVPVVAGSTYLLRVGSRHPSSPASTDPYMTFDVAISYTFDFSVAYDSTTSTVVMTDVAGLPGHFVLNALTLNLGAYPAGWLYGVDIPIAELSALYFFGPPFFVVLDAAGAFSQTITGVPPLGLTFYGAGLMFTPSGFLAEVSDAFSVTLL